MRRPHLAGLLLAVTSACAGPAPHAPDRPLASQAIADSATPMATPPDERPAPRSPMEGEATAAAADRGGLPADNLVAAPPALPFVLRHEPLDAAEAARVERLLLRAGGRLQAFFGFTTSEPVVVTIHPDRAAFDASFPPEWGLSQTACWMVASGVAGRLDLLSPRVWPSQACEHDAADERHLELLLTHELVHVVHGERNPTGDFTGAEQVGWFAEGLATYASGQLDGDHADAARQALAADAGPASLETAWSGSWRYGVCGSLVRHIDRRLGRTGLILLLGAVDNATILAALDSDEARLLVDWRAEVLAGE